MHQVVNYNVYKLLEKGIHKSQIIIALHKQWSLVWIKTIKRSMNVIRNNYDWKCFFLDNASWTGEKATPKIEIFWYMRGEASYCPRISPIPQRISLKLCQNTLLLKLFVTYGSLNNIPWSVLFFETVYLLNKSNVRLNFTHIVFTDRCVHGLVDNSYLLYSCVMKSLNSQWILYIKLL